jgi:hypothetical protein
VEQVHTELKLSRDILGGQSKMRTLMGGKGGYAVHWSRRRMGKGLQASELTGGLLR